MTCTVAGRRARGRVGRSATRQPSGAGRRAHRRPPTVCDVPSGSAKVAVKRRCRRSQRHGAARSKCPRPPARPSRWRRAAGPAPAAVASVTVTAAPGGPLTRNARNQSACVDASRRATGAWASAAATTISGRTQHHKTARRVIDRRGLLHRSLKAERTARRVLTLACARPVRLTPARPRGLPLRRVCRVLPGRAAASRGCSCRIPARGRRSALAASYVFYAAADVRFCALLAAVTLVNQAGAVLVGPRDQRPREERDRRGHRRARPARPRVFQVLRLLRLQRRRAASRRRARRAGSAAGGGASRSACRSSPSRRSATSSTSAAGSAIARRRSTWRSTCRSSRTSSPGRSSARASSSRSYATPRDPRDVAVGAGVLLIIFGLIKKVVIADFLARNRRRSRCSRCPRPTAPRTRGRRCSSYAVQIYCDFSGYTDIAIGLALLMGFVFPQNFDRPIPRRAASASSGGAGT